MKRNVFVLFTVIVMIISTLALGCSTAYKVKPMAFRMPSEYTNVTSVGRAQVAAKAFTEKTEAQEAFGFDIIGAGLLPVQLVWFLMILYLFQNTVSVSSPQTESFLTL